MNMSSVNQATLLGHRLDVLNRDQFSNIVSQSVKDKNNGYVTFVNAHMIVEASENKGFAGVLESSMLNLCDGMSIIHALR